jgi:hypothetical protein
MYGSTELETKLCDGDEIIGRINIASSMKTSNGINAQLKINKDVTQKISNSNIPTYSEALCKLISKNKLHRPTEKTYSTVKAKKRLKMPYKLAKFPPIMPNSVKHKLSSMKISINCKPTPKQEALPGNYKLTQTKIYGNNNKITLFNRFGPLHDLSTDENELISNITDIHSPPTNFHNQTPGGTNSPTQRKETIVSQITGTTSPIHSPGDSNSPTQRLDGNYILTLTTPVTRNKLLHKMGGSRWNSPHKKTRTKRNKSRKFRTGSTRPSKLRIACLNAQSIRNKTTPLREYIIEKDLDIFFIVETWLSEAGDEVHIGDITPEGYRMISKPRKNRQGGGIMVIYKDHISLNLTDDHKVSTMEILTCKVTIDNKNLKIICVYRPETTVKNKYKLSKFFEDLSDVLSSTLSSTPNVLAIGDYNFHMNNKGNNDTIRLQKVLDTFGLKQHVSQPTHQSGNTLDLIITPNESHILSHTVDDRISDHDSIILEYDINKIENPIKEISFRKLKNMNMEALKEDVESMANKTLWHDNLDVLVNEYNTGLTSIIDSHAPLQIKTVTLRDPTPWTNEEIAGEKKERRRLERKMKKTNNEGDKVAFKIQRNKYNNTLRDLRRKHFKDQIAQRKNDPKGLFKTLNALLHRKNDTPLPPHKNESELANKFNDFFLNKVENIRDELDKGNNQLQDEEDSFSGSCLTKYKILTPEEVKKLVFDSSNKSCELDPIPTYVLRDCIEEILPLLTKIVNKSLQLGNMPVKLKNAIIRPLLKKLGLTLIEKNYRPVSNLAFLGKLIERASALQIVDHITSNNLMDFFQSAYRKYHSTETALLRVKDDIQRELDNSKAVMLVLLDLSAAFDTIDHNILIKRLNKKCGVRGTALKWIKSYLSERTCQVIINGKTSNEKDLKYGVPQGSVLGPILFSIYMSPLGEIIKKHGLNYHIYADDTQIYIAFSPNEGSKGNIERSKLEACIRDVKVFLLRNKMKFNDGKTEFIILNTKNQAKKIDLSKIQIGNTEINKKMKVRNLGVIFDNELAMESHINQVIRKGHFHLRNLSAIRPCIDRDTANIAAHAFITSVLDYGNSLLYGVNKIHLNKLQRLQNNAARIVTGTRRFDHITPILKELHWLPVVARIEFKILLITWKALNKMAPGYITELIEVKEQSRVTRSSSKLNLVVPITKLVTCGDRRFSKIAPMLWNQIPQDLKEKKKIESFKNNLKTYLFKKYYNM